jgi:ribosomal protein S6--L-glutamate ligase
VPIPGRLAEAARAVGRLTGLEVYGLDFVGSPAEVFLVDVNPFPSFRALPRAADALWDYVEKR